MGHIVPVEFLLAAGAVNAFEEGEGVLVAADIDLIAALHPQHGLDQPVDIVMVGLAQRLRAVDERLDRRHLAVCTLYGDADRLGRVGQERLVEALERQKARIERGDVFDGK